MNLVTIQAILSVLSVTLTDFLSVLFGYIFLWQQMNFVRGEVLKSKKYTISYFSSVLIPSFQSVQKLYICCFSHVLWMNIRKLITLPHPSLCWNQDIKTHLSCTWHFCPRLLLAASTGSRTCWSGFLHRHLHHILLETVIQFLFSDSKLIF